MGIAKPEVEAKWRERVAAWRSSGMGARAFAEREGLRVASLWAWKRRLEPEAPLKLVPVVVRNGARTGSTFEVVVNGRYAVRVPPDFEETSFSRLLAVLDR
jgi:hypothetical protein